MSDAIAILFNPDPNTLPALSAIARPLSITLRPVTAASEFSMPLGRLLAAPVAKPEPAAHKAPFDEAVMVMCGFDEAQFDAWLRALREPGLPRIPLKAVLTPVNIAWTAIELREELVRERAEILRRRAQQP